MVRIVGLGASHRGMGEPTDSQASSSTAAGEQIAQTALTGVVRLTR